MPTYIVRKVLEQRKIVQASDVTAAYIAANDPSVTGDWTEEFRPAKVDLYSWESTERRRKMKINYNHLYYFYMVAVKGTIREAAEYLGVTQPTVSEQLRRLEDDMGLQLFDRSRARMDLTVHGKEALRICNMMFEPSKQLQSWIETEKTIQARRAAAGPEILAACPRSA